MALFLRRRAGRLPRWMATCCGCGAEFSPSIALPHKLRRGKHLEEEQAVFELAWKNLSSEQRLRFHLNHPELKNTTENEDLIGETQFKSQDMEQDDRMCPRCHSLVHHNTPSPTALSTSLPIQEASPSAPLSIFKPKKRTGLTIVAFDITDFPFSLPPLEHITESPFSTLFVATKVDLLLEKWENIYVQRLSGFIRRYIGAKYPRFSMNHRVHLVSSRKNVGIRELARTVQDLRLLDESVTVTGFMNAGKSELCNALLRISESPKRKPRITKSWMPGTTMGDIRIPLLHFQRSLIPLGSANEELEHIFLIDTPGIQAHSSAVDIMSLQDLRWLNSARDGKAMTVSRFRIKPGHSVFLGGLVRLDFLGSFPYHTGKDENKATQDMSRRDMVVCMTMTHLPVHCTNTEQADKEMDRLSSTNNIPNHLYPPFGPRIQPMPPMRPVYDLSVSPIMPRHDGRVTHEVGLHGGLGWFSFTPTKDMERRWRIWSSDPNWVWHRQGMDVLMPWEARKKAGSLIKAPTSTPFQVS